MSEVTRKGSRAYVTLLGGNGDYVKGVVGLAKGLRKVKSAYPLVVAVLPDVPEDDRQLLVAQGCILRPIELLQPSLNSTDSSNFQYARADYSTTYAKLRIWEFAEYSKMIFIDADIQVYDNLDHLFDLPNGYIYGVISCFCSPWWKGTPQYKVGYCQQLADKVHWPTELYGPAPSSYFNSGFFIFEPSLSTYQHLIDTLKITPPSYFSEQDFMNTYFKEKFKALAIEYNLLIFFLWRHPDKVPVDIEKVKVVHYCAAGSKPWRYTGKEECMDREDVKMFINKWWDIYNDPSLDYQLSSSFAACR